MAYGENKGLVSGQFGVWDYVGLAVFGGLGILIAALADFFMKPNSSSLYVFNQWMWEVTSTLGLPAPSILGLLLILSGIGAGSVFYFQPVTRQGAFAQGFGLLAALVTLSPADTGVSADAVGDDAADAIYLEEISAPTEALDGHAEGVGTFNGQPAPRLVERTSMRATAANRYEIIFRVTMSKGVPENLIDTARMGDARARVYNPNTKRKYDILGPNARLDEDDPSVLVLPVGIPAGKGERQGEIVVRFEIPGYTILEETKALTVGAREEWTIEMEPSNIPLRLQRLGRTFKF
ncbi:MAG: hypothetical protein AAFR11_14730 [Pseudomonadota bacterium]